MNVNMIPATEKDRAFFRNVHHLAYRNVIEDMFGWDEAKQDQYADIDFNERNPHIILNNNTPIGVVGWQDKPDYLWFGPIFILPDHQGQGIGSTLVKKFIEDAHAQGKPLRLQTLRKNEGAKKLYENMGFKILEVTAVHWQMEYPCP